MRGVTEATEADLAKIVGSKKAALLKQYLRTDPRDIRLKPAGRL
jgi:hypothetical protein